MKKTIILFLIFTLKIAVAQDSLNHQLKEVVVTSLHQPSILFDLGKSIEVISYKKIATSPVQNVQDYLNYSNSVDLAQRGANGVQADASIRGGNFEQTLIMLDGIKIIDPQTGHHNLNLPITTLNIEQVEILKGGVSDIVGANAFSGLVNFRTKREKENSFIGEIVGGAFGLYTGSLFASYNESNISNNIALEKNHSDGYRANTDYDILNFSYGGSVTFSDAVIDLFLGYTDKSYGANSFYSSKYPFQFEHTKTTFAKASADFGSSFLNFSTKIYWRKNNDEFLLDKAKPDFYKNNHITNIIGTEAEIFLTSDIGKSTFGGEIVFDDISSNNLGNHNRNRIGLYLQHETPTYYNIQISLSGSVYSYSDIGRKLWPGISIKYSASDKLNLFASYNNNFRIPNYTELYYQSPTTEGNKDLSYEESSNYEMGIKYSDKYFSSTVSVFSKVGKNIIDWVLLSQSEIWKSQNIADFTTSGIEINFYLDFNHFRNFRLIKSIEFKYSFINSNYSTGEITSRYLLNYLRHQAVINIKHNIAWDISADWYFRYQDRYNAKDVFVSDISLRKSFSKFSLFIKATNLFDTEYLDFIGIPLPGRWISGGIKVIL